MLSVHTFVIHVLLRALCKNWLLKLCFYLVKMVQNCSGHQILNFPSSFWFIFSLFWMLKKIMVAIYTLNFPLKPKNHKSEKYFVLPLAPLCYLVPFPTGSKQPHTRNFHRCNMTTTLLPKHAARFKLRFSQDVTENYSTSLMVPMGTAGRDEPPF